MLNYIIRVGHDTDIDRSSRYWYLELYMQIFKTNESFDNYAAIDVGIVSNPSYYMYVPYTLITILIQRRNLRLPHRSDILARNGGRSARWSVGFL